MASFNPWGNKCPLKSFGPYGGRPQFCGGFRRSCGRPQSCCGSQSSGFRPNSCNGPQETCNRFREPTFDPQNAFGLTRDEWELQLSLLADAFGGKEDTNEEKTGPQFVSVKNIESNFEIKVDVRNFSEEEIIVKSIGKEIIISGEFNEKKDEFGWFSERFTRRFIIPDDVDMERVTSSLASNHVLIISAPKKIKEPTDVEMREVPVVRESSSGIGSDDGIQNSSQNKDTIPSTQESSGSAQGLASNDFNFEIIEEKTHGHE